MKKKDIFNLVSTIIVALAHVFLIMAIILAYRYFAIYPSLIASIVGIVVCVVVIVDIVFFVGLRYKDMVLKSVGLVLAVFIFPFLGHVIGMSDFGFGMWAGTAINDTSSVVAAGYSYSEAAGSYATIVKLTRALMIVPVCLFFAMLTARKAKAEGQGFDLKRIFPFFILWFVVASIVNTSGILPAEVSKGLGDFGKFCIVWSMAAIGLNTNLMSLVKNGVRPIFLGLCCWIAVAVVSLIVQHIVGIM